MEVSQLRPMCISPHSTRGQSRWRRRIKLHMRRTKRNSRGTLRNGLAKRDSCDGGAESSPKAGIWETADLALVIVGQKIRSRLTSRRTQPKELVSCWRVVFVLVIAVVVFVIAVSGILIGVWMTVAPIPVGLLFPSVVAREITIFAGFFLKVLPVGPVFVVVPVVIVLMRAVIRTSAVLIVSAIALVFILAAIVFWTIFLLLPLVLESDASGDGSRSNEPASEEKNARVSIMLHVVILSAQRTLKCAWGRFQNMRAPSDGVSQVYAVEINGI